MKHFFSYTDFNDINEDFNILLDSLNKDNFDNFVDSIELYEGKLKIFNKIKIWSKVPKIKKKIRKANNIRLDAIKSEVNLKKDIIKAINDEKEIDIDRMKDILHKKRTASDKKASVYEKEAGAIADGNEYLMKIIRVELAKGTIAQNDLKLEIAEGEEKEALESINNATEKIIREDLFDIKSKMKDPSYKSPEAKEVNKEENKYADLDVKDLKNDEDLTMDEKMEIIRKKWKTFPGDNKYVTLMKRSKLRQELEIIKGNKVGATKYDRDLINNTLGTMPDDDDLSDFAKRKADDIENLKHKNKKDEEDTSN